MPGSPVVKVSFWGASKQESRSESERIKLRNIPCWVQRLKCQACREGAMASVITEETAICR